MPNPREIYDTFVRANLPAGITYSLNRYWVSGKTFLTYPKAVRYLNYIASFGGIVPPLPPTPADYIVTNDAQWTALMANSAATLSGKIAEIQGPLGDTVLNGKAFTTPFVIRGGVGGSIVRFQLTGVVSNVTFRNITFQMSGWPKTFDSTFYFNGGTYSGLRYEGCTFRHGYGATLVDFDPLASYPEYTRVDNVRTATIVSMTTALSWQDPARTGGFIEFFNRGAATVYFAVGGIGVTATTGSTACPAGTKVRSSVLNPTVDTHIAVLAASGTVEVNARAEIGVTEYLANAFGASGSAAVVDVSLTNCECRDINNAFKGIPGASSLAILMDSRTRRVYQDQSAIIIAPGATGYILRNSFGLPCARSGIAENLNGDARDPHGDIGQSFGPVSPTGPIGPLYYAGNRQYMQPVRAGVTSQGLFISDNDFSPSYDGLYSVSDTYLAGSPNGINTGEASFPAGGVYIYGATVVDPRDITSQTRIRLEQIAANRHAYVGRSVSAGQLGVAIYDTSLDLTGVTNPATVFTDLSAANTATTRAALEAALTTVGPASGMGAAATANVIDWTTTDPTAVILWPLMPSGVEWTDLPSQAINTLITLPLRRVLNRRASQPVVPGVGVEWRSVATDGVTEVQAWTTASGTVQPNQFIQIRGLSSASGLTGVNLSITINGFAQSVVVTTTSAAPTVFHTQSGTGPSFKDPSNVPASTTKLEFKANIYPTGNPASVVRLFAQESTGCDLEILNTGALRVTIEDGNNVAVVLNQFASVNIDLNQWQEYTLEADHVVGLATLYKNGVSIGSWTWTPTSFPYFNFGREISFLGSSANTNLCPVGWQVEFAECYFTTSGTRTLRKRVSGNAATVNADPWKQIGTGNAT